MPRLPLRPTWNSPVILSFAMAACAAMALDGLAGGRALGQHVYATQLQPIPEPATWLLLVLGLVGCLVGRRFVVSGRVS